MVERSNMTTAEAEVPRSPQTTRNRIVLPAFSDALAIAWRGLLTYRRVPQLLVFSTIQPVVFVLMFRYVFGGAIRVPGVDYVDYLIPGIFVQTVVFGSIGTAIGLASDVQSGLLERFLSLPMARSAVLMGRTLADLGRNVFVVMLMSGVGFLVGYHLHTTALKFVAAMLLVLVFGYALSWVFATVGLLLGNPESAQAAAFPLMAPLVFASSAFVPVPSMPGWLQPFAEHQPVSVTASAARALTLGTPATSYLLQAIAWAVGILIVFVPIAVWRYRRAI
jgi:ABC-2 type transport system permease protein/oleandomycin transport system permease protein